MMRAWGALVAGLLALMLSACDGPAGKSAEAGRQPEQENSGSGIGTGIGIVNDSGTARAIATAGADQMPPGTAVQPDPEDAWLWLEERTGGRALSWVREHNLKTRMVLEADPRFALFKEQALAILTGSERIPYGRYRNGFVYNFWRDKAHPRGIWRRATIESYRSDSPRWETLLDVDSLAAAERVNWVLSGIDCLPPAYEHCMLALSRGGMDRVVFREWNAVQRKFVEDGFIINEGYSSVAWLDRDTLLVTSAYGRSALAMLLFGYRPNVRIWKRGTSLDDAVPVMQVDEKEGVSPAVSHRPEGTIAIIGRRVDFYDVFYYILNADGTTTQLPLPSHADLGGIFRNRMLFVLRKAWTPPAKDGGAETIPAGALIDFDLEVFRKTGELPEIRTLYVPDERSTIHDISTARDAIVLNLLDNVTSRLMILRLEEDEWQTREVAIPENSTATVGTDNFSNFVFTVFDNYLTPDRLFQLDVDTGTLALLRDLPALFNAEGLSVERFETRSKDGTTVPYFYIGPANAGQDGALPTLLYGYGGFNIAMTPHYMPEIGKLWLEKGGAFVVANIRGGGEFGPRWHEGGLGINRPRSFEDFMAVADDLVARGITSPRRLGIMGGSNGGLLVGVAFTQRPELYRAVICLVPVLDMIRYVKLPPGAYYTTEYGDPNDPEERKVVLGYSPYHNLKRDADYPEVFFLSVTNDDRVHPGHARKMAARMEEMGHEMLYYEESEGGHSGAVTILQPADSTAMQFVYLARKLMDGEEEAEGSGPTAAITGAGDEGKAQAAAAGGGG